VIAADLFCGAGGSSTGLVRAARMRGAPSAHAIGAQPRAAFLSVPALLA
jgi:site-specific DNA-cytosine methylase